MNSEEEQGDIMMAGPVAAGLGLAHGPPMAVAINARATNPMAKTIVKIMKKAKPELEKHRRMCRHGNDD